MSKLTIANVRKTTIRSFALGIICGGFITAGTIAAIPAKALPDTQLADIAVTEQPYICNALLLRATVSNLVTVLATVQARQQLSAYDTGSVVTMAVFDGCDQFVPVLQRFVAIYGKDQIA